MFKSLFAKKAPAVVTLASGGRQFTVPGGQTMLEAALAAGIGIEHDCKVGSCGACKYRLLSGKVSELSPSALALTAEQLQQGYRLACQCVPKSDLEIAVDTLAATDAPAETVAGKIVRMAALTHDIIGLSIQLDRPLVYTAGQYADLRADAVAGARSYSFASAPEGGGNRIIDFHIRLVPGGEFTGWLFSADRTGGTIYVSGPHGSFGLRPSEGKAETPIVCIGGGSGLAPLRAILQQARSEGSRRPVTLLFGARTAADLYCLEEIAQMRDAWRAPFEFLPVLSAEPQNSGWSGARGLVADFAPRIAYLDQAQAYLCGPPPMVDAAEAILLRHGVHRQRIFADRFYDRSRPAEV